MREENIDEIDELVRKVVEEYVPKTVAEVVSQEDVIISNVVADSIEGKVFDFVELRIVDVD